MKKKLLVIGAGESQVSIIKTAKEQGIHVIVVSPVSDEPGVSLADEYFNCDIFDIDRLVEFAKEKNVDGVLTDQSDKATPVVAQIADKLGLPSIGYYNALCFTDKSKMREVYGKLGLPVAKNYTTTNVEEAVLCGNEIGFPVVIKPVDSFASRGVHAVLNGKELKEKYDDSLSVSKKKKVIVEKFIQGPQFFSQGYVDHGKLNLFAFSDRYYFNVPDVCLPYTNAFPALIDTRMKERMTNAFSKVISYLNPLYGQVWAEWIYDDKNDELYIIEMAIRGAGALVTTDIIPNAYGIDTQAFLVNDAIGNHKDWFANIELKNYASAFYCFLIPPGRVIKVEGLDKISNILGVTNYHMKDIKVGDIIAPYKDKNSRYGPIVIKGKTREELNKIRFELMKTIDIEVIDDNGNIHRAIWE